ncbi:MAG: nucleotidyltransferase domain-containing protein, partial [Gallintestinimicrobium sp.]
GEFMLSDLMKEDLIKGLLDIFSGDIEAIILYGSVARNESTPESDIDIAVIIKREMDDEKNGNVLSICFGLIET